MPASVFRHGGRGTTTFTMHTQPTRFMRQLQKQYPEHFFKKKVLEAAGDMRHYFSNCSYAVHHGVQATPIHRLDMPGAFDVIVHAGTLHYDRNWINTLCTMYRNIKNGGALIVTCAGPKSTLYEDEDIPVYYHPVDIEEITALLPITAFTAYQIGYAAGTHELEFFGVKK